MKKRLIIVCFLIFTLTLAGCWDERELDALFIVTGVAMDTAQDPKMVDITLQVSKAKSTESNSGGEESKSSSMLLLKTTRATILEGLVDLNRNTSRTLILQHNQALIFGSDYARQGVQEQLDLFLRDQEARMELLIVVTTQRAEDVLRAETGQEDTSSMALSRMLGDMNKISPHYKIRMLDFVSRLRDGSIAPVVPLISVKPGEEEGQSTIKLEGMAVFSGDKMVGTLNSDEMRGYIMAMGDVRRSMLAAETDLGRVVLYIEKLDTKRKVTVEDDGTVKVTLDIFATMTIGQLSGFENLSPKELMPLLVSLAEKKIEQLVRASFETAKSLNADIFGFGASVHKYFPRKWKSMKDSWDQLFAETQLDMHVEVHIPMTGQIVKPVGMEE